jgi:signal transduction histidine kinase
MPDARASVLAAIAVAGVAVGLAAEASSIDTLGVGRAAADLIVGWTFIGAGIAGFVRGRGRAATLLIATGMLWFAGSFWDGALYLHRAPLVMLVVGLPMMRSPRPAEWTIVVLGCLVAVDPLATTAPLTATVSGALAVLGVRRGIEAATPSVIAACALAATAMGVSAIASATTQFSSEGDALLLAYQAALVGVALCALNALPIRIARGSVVADLVVELGGGAHAAPVRDALAEALGDPSLVVAYRVDPEERYVDEQGRPVADPAAGPARAVTYVEGDGRRMAAVAYDPATIDDPRLLDAVATAARLMLTNDRLHAHVSAQLDDLRASRRRLLDAADDERARLEQRLHDGAEQRLEAFARLLADARLEVRAIGDENGAALLDAAAQELERACSDVRAIGRGLHPRTLSERGLGAAVSELAEGSPLAVDVTVPAERFSRAVEATAYFVCAEALANVGKYAGASRVACRVSCDNGMLRVVVEDDGAGGADVAGGTGLRGLGDRVSSVGGELRVVSPIGGGTMVTAEIPVRWTR